MLLISTWQIKKPSATSDSWWVILEVVAKEINKYYILDSVDGTESGFSEFWRWICLKVITDGSKNDAGGRVMMEEMKGPDMQNLKSCMKKYEKIDLLKANH